MRYQNLKLRKILNIWCEFPFRKEVRCEIFRRIKPTAIKLSDNDMSELGSSITLGRYGVLPNLRINCIASLQGGSDLS